MTELIEFFMYFLDEYSAVEGSMSGLTIGWFVNWCTSLSNNRRIKDIEYQHNHYQALIKKKMAVYEQLELALEGLNAITVTKPHNIEVASILLDKEKFRESYLEFQRLKHKMRWLTKDTRSAYRDLSLKLLKLQDLLCNESIDQIELNTQLYENSAPLMQSIVDLMSLVHYDFLNIHQKDAFEPAGAIFFKITPKNKKVG